MERVAGHVACWHLGPLRPALQNLLQAAGEPGGLCAEEVVALSLLSVASLGVASTCLIRHAELGWCWSASALSLSAALPIARMQQEARRRAADLERSLPTAMDLSVLCMGAGADFPAALRFVAGEIAEGHPVCHQELSLVLDELELGRTRVQALTGLGQRTHSRAVRDFTAAVCQSETKGTPLIDALSIQASTLRQRRSVLAEEAAAKAGVRLIFPLMLMVTSLLLIVFGPFIVDGIGM
jgi:tight adherence protein C